MKSAFSMISTTTLFLLCTTTGCASTSRSGAPEEGPNVADPWGEGGSGNGSGIGGSGGTGGDASAQDFPHEVCAMSESSGSQFKGVGDSCAMGSNVDLCAAGDSEQCPSTGVCMWDAADPTGTNAYCSIPCDPNNVNSCPDSFSCKKDSCLEIPVCVRTSMPPPPPAPPYTEIVNPLMPASVNILAGGIGTDGTAYWTSEWGQTYSRTADGTFSFLGDVGKGDDLANGLLVAGNTAYVYGGSYFNGWIAVISGGIVIEYATKPDIDYMFRTPTGKIIVVAHEYQKPEMMYEANEEMVLTPLNPPANGLIPGNGRPLPGGGFVGYCKTATGAVACAGTDGLDTVSLGDFKVVAQMSGTRPDDIWGLSPEFEIMHWDGQVWTKENVPPIGDDPSFIHVLSEKSVIAVASSAGVAQVMHFDGQCWKSVIPKDASQSASLAFGIPVTLGPERVGMLTSYSYIDFDFSKP